MHRAQSFLIVTSASDLPLRPIKCCSVVFGVKLTLLVINTLSSSPVKNKRRHGRRSCVLHLAVEPFTVRDRVRYWLGIAIFAYLTCIWRPVMGSPSEYCDKVWCGKTTMVCLPEVKRFRIMFIRFDRIHERDGQTDRRTGTAWRHRPYTCIALYGKSAILDRYLVSSRVVSGSTAKSDTHSFTGSWQVGDTGKRRRLLFAGTVDKIFMTRSLNVTLKTTEQNLMYTWW